jgi:hypothetical protein
MADLRRGANRPTIQDSGTNVDVVSMDTAVWLEEMGVVTMSRCDELSQSNNREFITFGKEGSVEEIVGYIEGNGLLGRIAIVKNIEVNLIGLDAITTRGMIAEFTEHTVKIKYGGDTVFIGYKDNISRLYQIDLVQMLRTPCPISGDRKAYNSMATTNTKGFGGHIRPRFKAQAIRKAREAHAQLKHIPYSIMADNIEIWEGFDNLITPALLRQLAAEKDCVVCAQGRWNQTKRSGSGLTRYKPGEAFSVDYQGKYTPMSQGCSGFVAIKDLATGVVVIYGVKSKTSVGDAIKSHVVEMMAHGLVTKFGSHDSGSVEVGSEFKVHMAALGIKTIPSPPEIPAMDIERSIQTLQNDAAVILETTPTLRENDWLPAVKYAAVLRSTVTNERSRMIDPLKTPYELLYGTRPRMENLMELAIGDVVVVRTPEKKRGIGTISSAG